MIRRTVTVVLASACLGCQQDPKIPTLPDGPLTLTMSLSTTQLVVGLPDTISVTATNTLDQQGFLDFPTNCPIVVTIRNQSGTVVAPPNERPQCLPIATRIIWPPKASVTRTFIWTGGLDFLPADTQQKVPPGIYFASATMNAIGFSTFTPAFKITVAAGS